MFTVLSFVHIAITNSAPLNLIAYLDCSDAAIRLARVASCEYAPNMFRKVVLSVIISAVPFAGFLSPPNM